MKFLRFAPIAAYSFLLCGLFGEEPVIKQSDELLPASPSNSPIVAPPKETPTEFSVTQNLFIEQVIRDQLEALRGNDYSKAYFAFTSVDFQKSVSLPTFKLFIQTNRLLAMPTHFEIDGITYDGVLAKVKGKISDAYGGMARVEFDLIQENGLWKIRRFDLSRVKGKST